MHRKSTSSSPLADRIDEQKKLLEAEIARAEPGHAGNDLQQKIRQLDVASHLTEWLSSPGLQAPR